LFLIHFLRWLFGWVKFDAEGGFPERLLNLAAREGIDLWSVRRTDEKLRACCPARQYRLLRSPARRAGMRIHITQKNGVPFVIKKYKSRSGVFVGLIAFFVLLNFLSQRVWVVEVRGNNKVEKEEIIKVMEEFGVSEGKDISALDIPTLQLQALQKLPKLAWCVVNLQGSIAYIDVTERIPTPELSNANRPSNIKAARDGRIVSIEVYTGQAMVQKGDAVAQGMLLVSGVVESSVGPIFRRSQARILAETTRNLKVSVPLKENRLMPTGRKILRPYLHFFTLNIPMFTDGKIEQENRLQITKNMLKVNGIHLPVGIINRSYELLELNEIVRTESQAKELAHKLLSEKKLSELASVEIINANEKGMIANGEYVLTGEYDCIEDICIEEQLIVE
jgi:similar to stage IV sporulation protein